MYAFIKHDEILHATTRPEDTTYVYITCDVNAYGECIIFLRDKKYFRSQKGDTSLSVVFLRKRR